MKLPLFILSLSFVLLACQSPSTRPMLAEGKYVNSLNNKILLQQIKNDEIIRGANDGSTDLAPTIFEFDGKKISQTDFQALHLDTFFYIQKKFGIELSTPNVKDLSDNKRVQQTYQGFSPTYFASHQFTPSHFDLHFDENDLLFLSVAHPVKGQFFAYGFDKMTGKQAVTSYMDDEYNGNFAAGNQLKSRQIDELRLVVTLNDSIYIHDFPIEDFYTHDH